MVYSEGLAVGLSIGVPTVLIILVVGAFWYRNQRRLNKEDVDNDYIDKEIQNDDSSFRQFQEQLHKQRDYKKDDDGLQLKEHVVPLNGTSDSSNGSLSSVLHQSQELSEPQPAVSRPTKHPYGQHLQNTPSSTSTTRQASRSSISLSQTSDNFSNTYQSQDELQNTPRRTPPRRNGPPPPPHRQSSNKGSAYAFYDTFIPTFSEQQKQQQQQQQNTSLSHPNSTHNSFSDLLNQTAHSSLNILKTGHKESTNTTNNNQHKHSNSASDSNTSLLHNNSTSHSRAPSTDLDTLAKQLQNPEFFEKLPSKAAAAQGKVYIKPRVPSSNQANNSSSELINNHLIGENTALNENFTYEAPMVETAQSTDNLAKVGAIGGTNNQVLTYNQYLSTKAATVDPSLRRPSQTSREAEDEEAVQKANPLNGQIGNAFDANIAMEPMAMNKKNTTTNKDEDVVPPVVFQ
ncbi:SKG1 [Candida metapsilosis]|uniref:SKG1 n=1 Tax=Candida metapsilosis TaxID=273372 RepID=A0A8H8D9R3_9ASCO|nr:SKG1 [Candida metapsilosis]